MTEQPTFGHLPDEVERRLRAGAYAIIFDEHDRFASVKSRQAFLLPGGGIEADESPEDALTREVAEECAREVTIGRFLGSAIQFHTDHDSGQHWELHCSYFAASFGASLNNEPEHELHWLELDEADKLAFDVHRWGLNQVSTATGRERTTKK